MAVFTFKHSFVSRGKHAPGTAAAHINYITRKAATCLVRAEGIVKPPGMDLRGALWRFTNEREASIRKNGRVMDKFIIALPKEMSLAEMDGCLDRFGRRIKLRWCPEQGRLLRGVFGYTIQDFDTHNPHAHCVFYDADQKTGERVFGTTKKGSTERLRAAWEDTANAELERLGYEARIDRRPQRVIDAELEATVAGPAEGSPEVHTEGLPEGEEAAPSHAPTETLEEAAPEEQAEALVEPEPDMTREEKLDAIHQDLDSQLNEQEQPDEQPPRIVAGKKPESVAGKVKGSIELAKRSRELRGAKSRLQTALDWHDKAVAAQGVATVFHRQLETDINEFNDHHRGPMGRGLAGFNVFGWKILGRKEAETAQQRVATGQATYKALYGSWVEKKRTAELQEAATQADQRQIEGYARMTPEERRQALQGMEQASDIIDRTHAETLEGVSAAQVYEAFKRGELTADEAMETCAYLGDRVFAARIAQEAELEEEQELGM